MSRSYVGRIAVTTAGFAAAIILGLGGVQTSRGQSQSSQSGLPSEMPARIVVGLGTHEAVAHERRRERVRLPAGRERHGHAQQGRADPPDAHSIRRRRTDDPRSKYPPRSHLERL